MITPFSPPRDSCLASISPKVLDTDNRPGSTLSGPETVYPLALENCDWYNLPPALIIRCCSEGRDGLWSLVTAWIIEPQSNEAIALESPTFAM